MDDIFCEKAVAFGEFGVDDGVHLKCGDVCLPEIRIIFARSVQVLCAQGESCFLCVMVGVFVCDG